MSASDDGHPAAAQDGRRSSVATASPESSANAISPDATSAQETKPPSP